MRKILSKKNVKVITASVLVLVLLAIGLVTKANGEESITYNSEKNFIYAYISGEVKNPGMYELQEGSTYYDVVRLAGASKKANLEMITLGNKVEDGIFIVVPSIDEKDKISINNCKCEDLIITDGKNAIKKTLAQQIIDYRVKNKGYRTIDELKNAGLTDSAFDSLKKFFTL